LGKQLTITGIKKVNLKQKVTLARKAAKNLVSKLKVVKKYPTVLWKQKKKYALLKNGTAIKLH